MPSHRGHGDGGLGDGGPEFFLEQEPVSAQLGTPLPSGSTIPRFFGLSNGAPAGATRHPISIQPDDVAADSNYTTVPKLASPSRAKRTVQVKRGNKLLRLFGVERTSLNDLKVTVVDEFPDEEAETQYEKYIDFLRNAPPEKHPLGYFRKINRALKPDKALASILGGFGQDPVPYIQFTGLRDESEVMILHAALFRIKYCPPMPVCYVMQQIRFLASQGSQVESMSVNSGTLCGSLVNIGTGNDRQIATIGGVVESDGDYFALTTGHPYDGASDPLPRIKSFFSALEVELDEDDYNDDTPPPLVVDTVESHKASIEPLFGRETIASITPGRSYTGSVGSVIYTGTDWALVNLASQPAPLNCIDERLVASRQDLEDILSDVIFLSGAAPKPEACDVLVSAGRSGLSKLELTKKPADLMLPSGTWIRPWKAKLKPGMRPTLQYGDSGAWVVNIDSSTVYGHIMAVAEEEVYIQPLVDIFQDLQTQKHMDVKIASPFSQLADFAKYHHLREEHHLAARFAHKALDSAVISQSTEPPQVSAMLQAFQTYTETEDANPPQYSRREIADFLAKLMMRTGRHIDLTQPLEWDDECSIAFGSVELVIKHVNALKRAGGLPTLEKSAVHSGPKMTLLEIPKADPRGRSTVQQDHRNTPPGPATKIIKRAYDWARLLFSRFEMQFTMVGLPGCGKSDLLRRISSNDSTIASISTVGFSTFRTTRIKKGYIKARIWDLKEGEKWHANWIRYSRGVDGIIFVIDTKDTALLPEVRRHILQLLSQPTLADVPLIVLGNNSGLLGGLAMDELIIELDLDQALSGRHVDFWGGDKASFDDFLDFLVQERNK
ncbi:ADP-ribosylation factor-like protein 8 [Fusarium austroafricanum]|uniref:ADP-ribosylation factor-like protein 8 n=1 Tax=Fusarium austroafricanum TaxID=2364996 RepID=A0A8H4NZA4_9HYPO|nr:ADP-ribosylation factor-like protein 8 [Fusarium austroafricanum]